MIDLDRAETCRGWRNMLRISSASSLCFFTWLCRDARSTKHKLFSELNERQCTCNIEARSGNHCYSGRAIHFTYCVCVFVALIILHTKCIRPIKILSVACLAVSHFSTYFLNGCNFREKVLGRKMSVLIFSTTLAWNSSYSRRTERDMIKNVCWSSSEIPFMHVRC